jgi:hypothetical protein
MFELKSNGRIQLMKAVVLAAFGLFFGVCSVYPATADFGQEEDRSEAWQPAPGLKLTPLTLLPSQIKPAGDQKSKPKSGRPPLKTGRVIKEAVLGIGSGFFGMMAGGFVGFAVSGGGAGWFDPNTTVGAAAATGYFLGVPWGVYLVGSDATQTGSLLATYLGAAAGVAFAIALPSFGTALLAPVVGACIGFNLTRRYKSPAQTGTALFNFRDGGLRLNFPLIAAAPDCTKRGSVRWKIHLVNIEI